jgi:Fe-S cluster biogenesis protein NfuA
MAKYSGSDMGEFDQLLARLEHLLAEIEQLDEPVRSQVFELLDGIDVLHRTALIRVAELLGPDRLAELREADPAVEWLLEAYGAGVDQKSLAVAALDQILPYIHSHGGRVEVLDASAGVVRLKLSGSCSGCTASAVTLQHGVEEALRQNMPGFVRMEVEEVDAPSHAPPGPTLLQIDRGPFRAAETPPGH